MDAQGRNVNNYSGIWNNMWRDVAVAANKQASEPVRIKAWVGVGEVVTDNVSYNLRALLNRYAVDLLRAQHG